MANRGQKRMEVVDELPADKRACSSLEFRPSTSNSSAQTQINSTNSTPETHETDMDTSSSASPSSRSDGEPEKDSAYGSCDSDDAEPRHRILRDYQRRRSSGDHGKLKGLLANLSEETEPSVQLNALTELCGVLSYCTEDSLSSVMADMLSPELVRLARHQSNAEIMLLAIRAITYLCDVFPRSSAFLVRHEAVPALCQRLKAIEYLDVAEQCLQALKKISRDQPQACLHAGAIMAVLGFIDFFSTSIQRVAVSTVVNICKRLPSESPSPFMEAVPILCNLLQYEDRQLVESVAMCLIKIAEHVSQSSAMLDELCRHGLIDQSMRLLNSNCRTTLSQPVYNGFIGLLARLSSASIVAFRSLYELNISLILKDILSAYDISHTVYSPHLADGRCSQVHEVLKLVNALLPSSHGERNVQLEFEKENFLVNHPDVQQRFGEDLLPVLIQVVNSGAKTYVCYGCLSAIKKLIRLSKSDTLVELLKGANISSVLAGVFTRKDPHVLVVALEIVEMVLQKFADTFLTCFIKEGILFAINALSMPERSSQSASPVFLGIQLPSEPTIPRATGRESVRCLCYAFDNNASTSQNCLTEKNSVSILAENIKTAFCSHEFFESEKGWTDVFQNLKSLSSALNELASLPSDREACSLHEERFCRILCEIVEKLNGGESVSTFEFVESGIVRSLMNYLSDGLYLRDNIKGDDAHCQLSIAGKRFEAFARLLWPSSDNPHLDSTLTILIQKLQNAFSSLETFPVILTQGFRQRNSFATVPNGRCTMYPCLRVRFVKGEGETSLCDYSQDYVTVDPFSCLDDIEGFLWPKVNTKKAECVAVKSQPMECQPPHLSSAAHFCQDKISDPMETDRVRPEPPAMQDDQSNVSSYDIQEGTNGSADSEQITPEAWPNLKTQDSGSSIKENTCPRLSFHLEGHHLDRSMTLYQAIVQQRLKSEGETLTGAKLWSQVYTVTYRKAEQLVEPQESLSPAPSKCEEAEVDMQSIPLLSSVFACEFASCLEKSNPTYDILFLLKSLEAINRFAFHLMSLERVRAFAKGRLNCLDRLKVLALPVPQVEFVSSRLTEKLEQQMRDSAAISVGSLPAWCNQLVATCPFLFSFEVKSRYFRLAAFGPQQAHYSSFSPHSSSAVLNEGRPVIGSLPRKKFLASRDQILESATRMMELHAHQKVNIEVEYDEEVGTGLGPTLEFYTLVSHEFQKRDLGMWREDYNIAGGREKDVRGLEMVMAPSGLFPRPWYALPDASDVTMFSAVVKRFSLLGQIVAKAIEDGRVLDLPFSKAFYKLLLEQELSLYDIHSFDPELGKTLLELQAISHRKNLMELDSADSSALKFSLNFRDTEIEDLCLDFTLPGYPDYVLASGSEHSMVTLSNLDDYVKLVVDATVRTGVRQQIDAFKSGFNKVFPIKYLKVFNEDELERLFCGERDFWNFNEVLDHIKFDHGYTANSPPVINLLEILREFDYEQRRAFLRFVTGAPRLPPGGLASLNPKLTIVRKHCSDSADTDLPSVMTCANYLKLPPYTSKEKMKEKLLYAITEGQGSFHLS